MVAGVQSKGSASISSQETAEDGSSFLRRVLPQSVLTLKLGSWNELLHGRKRLDDGLKKYDPQLIRRAPRGGLVLTLADGLQVQLGIPMWTSKDVFGQWVTQGGFSNAFDKAQVPSKVPTIFIFDPDYDPRDGLTTLDFLQYLFFVTKGTTMRLILPNEKMARFGESMLDLAYMGDRSEQLDDLVAAEYGPQAAGTARLLREMTSFPSPPTHVLREISHFDAREGAYALPNGQTIRKLGSQLYGIYQGDEFLGSVNLKDYPLPETEVTDVLSAHPDNQRLRDNFLVAGAAGLWPIGTAHGFDATGETSGHMIWNRGRVILVDPPSITLNYLKANRIPLDVVDGIIVTHGHTDHFGNSIIQLLEALPRVKLYSTKTIFSHLAVQYLLSQGGLGALDWALLHRRFQDYVPAKRHAELHRRFRNNAERAPDDPHNLYLFIDLLVQGRRDAAIKRYCDDVLAQLEGMAGAPILSDWDFVEVKPKQPVTLNGLDFHFNYGFHPVAAKGHEIWSPGGPGRGQLMVYFTGDTMAVPFDQEFMGQRYKGVLTLIQEGVFSVERGLDVLKHYFLIPLATLMGLKDGGLDAVTRARTVSDFIQSEAAGLDFDKFPQWKDELNRYVRALALDMQAQKEAPLFLIEGGIPPIHIQPSITQNFLNRWESWFLENVGGTQAHQSALRSVTDRVLIYHTSDKPTKDAGATKWEAGYRGIRDLSSFIPHRERRLTDYWFSRLQKEPVLQGLDTPLLRVLMKKGELVSYGEGDLIITRKNEDQPLYYILEGEAHVLASEGGVLATKKSGFIGEGPLVGEKRSHDVRAAKETLALKFNPDDFVGALSVVKERLLALRRNRMDFEKFLKNGGTAVQGLEHLWDGVLTMAKARVLKPGETLLSAGEAGQDVFLVTGGEAVVDLGTKKARVRPGGLVGEMSYVFKTKRAATVRAGRRGLRVLQLGARELDGFSSPGFKGGLRAEAYGRLMKNSALSLSPLMSLPLAPALM